MKSTSLSYSDRLTPLVDCFSDEEIGRLRTALELAPQLTPELSAELEQTFQHATESLPLVAQAIRASPRSMGEKLGKRRRDSTTLVERLCQSDQPCLEFAMPTGAVLGRAFVLAKLNFLKAVEYSFEAAGDDGASTVEILKDLVGDAVLSRLAEELLSAIAANPRNDMDLRRSAAQKLIAMWDERFALPMELYASVLLSAWRARGKVRAIFGTLIGVNEVFSLIQAECPPRFFEYFERDKVTTDEREAFREFLFGISYEDLQNIRAYMEENGLSVVGPEQVRDLISSPQNPLFIGDPHPEQMYSSYCRRRIRADYRVVARAEGPWKTAEGYIMESLLRE